MRTLWILGGIFCLYLLSGCGSGPNPGRIPTGGLTGGNNLNGSLSGTGGGGTSGGGAGAFDGGDGSGSGQNSGNVHYRVTDLGTLGGENSGANAISNTGMVVGWAETASRERHAFLYSEGHLTDLGTLGGSSSEAFGINSAGTVVGSAINAEGATRAFVYEGGVISDLGTLGGRESLARAINDSGQIVGGAQFQNGSTDTHAVLWQNGQARDLGTLGGTNSQANAINIGGVIAGFSTTAEGIRHAFILHGTTMLDLKTHDSPGSQPTDTSEATGINEQEVVVGMTFFTFISQNSSFFYTGILPFWYFNGLKFSKNSVAAAINKNSVMVGSADNSDGTVHAYLYKDLVRATHDLVDLNEGINSSTGWLLESANGINDAGQIVGVGTIHGKHHAFLLTPL